MSPAGYSPWGHKDLDAAECARARVHTHTHTHTHENLFESYSDSNFRSDGKEATWDKAAMESFFLRFVCFCQGRCQKKKKSQKIKLIGKIRKLLWEWAVSTDREPQLLEDKSCWGANIAFCWVKYRSSSMKKPVIGLSGQSKINVEGFKKNGILPEHWPKPFLKTIDFFPILKSRTTSWKTWY